MRTLAAAGLVALLDGGTPPPLRRSVAEHAARAAFDGGPDAGARRYRELAPRKTEFYLSQNELRTDASGLQRVDRNREAAALLEAGAESFPNSAKLLDQLAQSYVLAGNGRGAREATRRLLALLQGDRVSPRERDDLRRSATERLARLDAQPAAAAAGDEHATGGGEPTTM